MTISVAQRVPAQWSRVEMLEVIRALEQELNLLSAGRLSVRGRAASVPTVGSYAVGDIVFNSAPTAGGTIGWVCTDDSPLTFKTWGAIAA